MPLLDLFWTILYIFLLFAWIWLLISVFGDIFRNDLSGLRVPRTPPRRWSMVG